MIGPFIDQVANRRTICLACESNDRQGGETLGKCTACGCWLQGKIRLPTAACPQGKWASALAGMTLKKL